MKTTVLAKESLEENLAQVERIVSELCDEHGFSGELFGNMIVALTEAVTNALQHGGTPEQIKQAELAFDIDADRVFFIVKDNGLGFDFNNLPDPLAPENIEKPSGRGIFLMKSLADKVEFTHPGNQVLIEFNTGK